jgi:peptide subunit release factor 1 (eRF1)
VEGQASHQEAHHHQRVTLLILTQLYFRNGTSFVSLYIPAKEQLARTNQMLVEELSGASQIKSRQTRQSVQSAITACKESKTTSN